VHETGRHDQDRTERGEAEAHAEEHGRQHERIHGVRQQARDQACRLQRLTGDWLGADRRHQA
jgi:hypothetical protein